VPFGAEKDRLGNKNFEMLFFSLKPEGVSKFDFNLKPRTNFIFFLLIPIFIFIMVLLVSRNPFNMIFQAKVLSTVAFFIVFITPKMEIFNKNLINNSEFLLHAVFNTSFFKPWLEMDLLHFYIFPPIPLVCWNLQGKVFYFPAAEKKKSSVMENQVLFIWEKFHNAAVYRFWCKSSPHLHTLPAATTTTSARSQSASELHQQSANSERAPAFSRLALGAWIMRAVSAYLGAFSAHRVVKL
jgi:hypothetical protein